MAIEIGTKVEVRTQFGSVVSGELLGEPVAAAPFSIYLVGGKHWVIGKGKYAYRVGEDGKNFKKTIADFKTFVRSSGGVLVSQAI